MTQAARTPSRSADEPHATPASVTIRDPDGRLARLDLAALGPRPLVVGRAADAQIRLDRASVSRRHAELADDGRGGWRVRDLGSRNGTLVNGQPVVGERPLAPGDRVGLGGFELELILPSAAPASPAGDGTAVLIADGPAGRVEALREMAPPMVAAAHLTAVNDLSRDLLRTADPCDRAAALCRAMARPPFHGCWAVVLRVNGADPDRPPEIACRVGGEAGFGPGDAPYVSRSVLRAVVRTNDAVMASNVLGQPGGTEVGRFRNVEMSIPATPGDAAVAAVACPLRRDGTDLEVLYVALPPRYGTGEWLALAALAAKQYEQAGAAWAARGRAEAHAALERELDRARQIQLRLVPRPEALARTQGEALELAVAFAPSRQVGGDYVDALAMRDGRVLLALADVSGHGIGAALVASGVHTLVRAGVRAGLPLGELMDNLNQHLCETLPGDAFTTMVAAVLDPRTGDLAYVNAGHPPPFVVSADGSARRLGDGRDAANLPLGLDADERMQVASDRLGAGQLLALYSDGLTEMADAGGVMLGRDGRAAALGRARRGGDDADGTTDAAGVALVLGEALERRRAGRPPADDVSFLLARRL